MGRNKESQAIPSTVAEVFSAKSFPVASVTDPWMSQLSLLLLATLYFGCGFYCHCHFFPWKPLSPLATVMDHLLSCSCPNSKGALGRMSLSLSGLFGFQSQRTVLCEIKSHRVGMLQYRKRVHIRSNKSNDNKKMTNIHY